jgi:hypothetical protein
MMVSLATHCCYKAGEKLTLGFRLVSGPSLHFPRFSRNQYALNLLDRREKFREQKPSREYLSNEFGTNSFSAEILMVYCWSHCHVEDILHSYD